MILFGVIQGQTWQKNQGARCTNFLTSGYMQYVGTTKNEEQRCGTADDNMVKYSRGI